ncbi:LacI family DNA-binding transcriptional regulator [Fusibacter bizertensis]|uniref:LacI family DNA-binding transcriptional regulator n=1 Tax=Fusibacter bizertensis TaxID=1488331 RepID=A0ABT6NHL5_9FIRM|nr:LacI family DNA-binding transcriptional regulator [Fusibacter bizertensis]MDH8679901.1 LacI family DNA-binding transcriptional regulator [Fusibacter bizertensis]
MKNLNIKDIAKLAGVGVSTVSRVINQHTDVKDETRKHVQEIIETYNYIPNNSARNLKRNESMDVGILIKGMYNPFFARMIQSIEKRLSSAGYSAIIHYNIEGNKDIDAANEFILEKKLKGVICLGGDFDKLTDQEIQRLGVPFILASTEIPENLNRSLFSSVIIDNEMAAYRAVKYLSDMGHNKIALITTGNEDKSIGTIRTQGYLRALSEQNIEKKENYFEVGAYTFETGYEAMCRLLEKANDITAVFAISDVMAIGAAKAMYEKGIKIPDDISLIGFDDIDYAEFFNPPLTTVHQPVEEIAESTADIMIGILDDNLKHQHIIFDTEIVIRNSCKQMNC